VTGSRADVPSRTVGSLFPSSEPLSRGIIFHTLHLALKEVLGGRGYDAVVARLPPEVALATSGLEFVAIRWYPTSHLMAWQTAMYEVGQADYDRCLDRSLDLAVGGVRRLFMKVLTPRGIAERAGDMWRHFHSHGNIELAWRSATRGRVILTNHAYVDSALGRRTFAEMIRYMLALSRAKGVHESHGLDANGRLAVTVSWQG
jgi:hypothetical protein